MLIMLHCKVQLLDYKVQKIILGFLCFVTGVNTVR